MFHHNGKKLIVAVLSSTFALNVYAASEGPYLGLMFGPGTNNAKSEQAYLKTTPPFQVTKVTPKNQQWATRLFLGYKIFYFGGAELGLTYVSTIHYDTKGVDTCGKPDILVRAGDIVLKGEVPFYRFDAYVKGGAAVTWVKTSSGLSLPENEFYACGKAQHKTQFNATYSIGASYDITQNWVVDVSYNVLRTGGMVNQVQYLAAGLSYHWVDVYCGQFLCDN